ncbi:sec-independent protein translocase protein TatC [Tistlia consotensis]|uniref:Sec-independent protein translocase protein TatC n=1 Tax=Tistlia consotensis USBA 355 TaxID=560819 RepID=A0A1Y6BJC5_9PROT|nr:twin-arginine translocase subunit TatC [Tistlia consotensis]SMF14169.1 sec-independent protein translocase protein TatC [Tistlia consotensis USBA 355]SNR49775.1 sec-independent protein translocase protein TatC [Tistlia consotensis]
MSSEDEVVEAHKMPLLDHLIELRQRLLYSVIGLFVAFLVCFFFAQDLYNFLVQPLANILLAHGQGSDVFMHPENQPPPRMIFTDLTEVFFTYIKVAFFFAAFIMCPLFLTQIWLFVAPGLYKNEKKALAPFLIASPILFLLGAALVYFVLLPFAWRFFLHFQQPGGPETLAIQLEAKVDQYLALTMKLIFAFGLCFQLPVIMTLLARVGLATSQGMKEKRKYAIVITFILAAIFTPPDPLSQISLALPILVLYEISIQMARLVEKERAKREAELDREAGID